MKSTAMSMRGLTGGAYLLPQHTFHTVPRKTSSVVINPMNLLNALLQLDLVTVLDYNTVYLTQKIHRRPDVLIVSIPPRLLCNGMGSTGSDQKRGEYS